MATLDIRFVVSPPPDDLEERRTWEWRPGDSRTDADRVFDRIELAAQGLPYVDKDGMLSFPVPAAAFVEIGPALIDPLAYHGECCPCAACAEARSRT